MGDFPMDEIGDSHDTIPSDDEEYCRRLNPPMDSPSIDIARECPGNPLASCRNFRPSDGQLNRSFRFGGSLMPSQRSDNSCSEEVDEVPLTLSDIIPLLPIAPAIVLGAPWSRKPVPSSNQSLARQIPFSQPRLRLPSLECDCASNRITASRISLASSRGTRQHRGPSTRVSPASALLAWTLSMKSAAGSSLVQTGQRSTPSSASLATTASTIRSSASLL